MKQLLFVLIVVGLCIPACADALVYVEKYNSIEIEVDPNTGQGQRNRESGSAYRILEQVDANTVAIWTIELWKDEDANGQRQKYCQAEPQSMWDFVGANVGEKLMWVIDYEDDDGRAVLMGWAKTKTIGGTEYNVPSVMKGAAVWDQIDDDPPGIVRDMGRGTLAFRLNARLTLRVQGLSGEQAVEEIINYLLEIGYIEAS